MLSRERIDELARQGGGEEMEEYIRSSSDLLSREAVEELTGQAMLAARVDLQRARGLAEAANVAAEILEDPYSLGLSCRSLANVLYLSGEYSAALGLYSSAVEKFGSIEASTELAKTLSNSIQSHILLGQYDGALAAADQAREIFGRCGDEMQLARLECNVGNILHRQDKFEEAMDCYDRSIEVFRREGGDPQALVAALLNSAVCLILLHDFDRALECYEEMSEHCRRHELALPAAQANYNIAYLYYHRGEYTRALELYDSAAKGSVESGDRLHAALCSLDVSEIYMEVQLPREGARLAQAAHRGFEELEMGYEASKALVFMAVGAVLETNLVRAVELFEEARAGYQKESNLAWCSIIDLCEAIVLMQARRGIEARRLANRCLAYFTAERQPARVALCHLVLARVELVAGNTDTARQQAHSALAAVEGLDVPNVEYLAQFVTGEIEELAEDPVTARESYSAAHDLLESLRSHLRPDELKVSFLLDKQVVYESFVDLCLVSGGFEERAFRAVENAKSRRLVDLIAFQSLSPPGSRTGQSDLVRQMRRLREGLNWYNRELEASELESSRGERHDNRQGALQPRKNVEDLRRLRQHNEEQLLDTLSRLRAEDEELAALQIGGSQSVARIREALPADTKMLAFYEARGVIWAFVLSAEGLEASQVTTGARAREAQRRLQFQLSKFKFGEEYVARFSGLLDSLTHQHLRELYDELVAPIRNQLDCRVLVVVPHGFLHHVPFHALDDGSSYLGDQYEMSYSPSASMFEICRRRSLEVSSVPLVLGTYTTHESAIRKQIDAVSAALSDARVLLGAEATVDQLRDLAPGSRVIHLATDRFYPSDNPMFSAIQLGTSRLGVLEIFQLDLTAELVVISGCGGRLESVENGDEIVALTRGILHAGASSAMTSLWDPMDESTAELMAQFYRRLEAGSNATIALQQAAIALREHYPHPYYWAPFRVTGNPFGSL